MICAEPSDYQTTMPAKTTGDYGRRTTMVETRDYKDKLCPIKHGTVNGFCRSVNCDGPNCAWWDVKRENCGILPLAKKNWLAGNE